MADTWIEPIESLETPAARRAIAAALVAEGVIENAHLGGDLASELRNIPPSRVEQRRIDRAVDIALSNLETELNVLIRRASVCFAVSIVMGVALGAAILWTALSGSVDKTKLLATLTSTAGGGGAFAYYKAIWNQANRLRKDVYNLGRVSEKPR